MNTLILSPRYSVDSNALWSAAVKSNWDVVRLSSPVVDPDLKYKNPVLYTDTYYSSKIAEDLGISLVSPPLDFLISVPYTYKLRNIAYETWKEASKIKERLFFKSADDKWFPAGVYGSAKEIPVINSYSEDAPILISEPVVFEKEFRFFIANNGIYTNSIYIIDGVLAKDDVEGIWFAEETELRKASAFVQEYLLNSEVVLPEAFVLDVGLIKNKGWAIVEANPAWASGICGCDPFQVLEVLRFCSVSIQKV